MKFEDYFIELLKKNNMSVSKLQKELNMKSRTGIYRFIQGECSKSKAIEIFNDIKKSGLLILTEKEWDKLYQLMLGNDTRKSTEDARKLLLNIYEKNKYNDYILDTELGDKKLSKILTKHKNAVLKVFWGDTGYELAHQFTQCLLKCNKNNLEINHYLSFKNGERNIASELVAIFKLYKFSGYNPYVVSSPTFKGITVLAKNENKHYITILERKNGKYRYIDTELTKDLYDYFCDMYMGYQNKGQSIIDRKSKVRDLQRQMSELSVFELNNMISLEGSFCFTDIMFDTITVC